jgi:hypothetical protein
MADKDGRTPLHDAAKAGSEDVIQLLLDKGANANTTDKDGRTPLHDAAKAGSEGVILRLLYKGADINAADEDRRTPLHDAAKTASEDVELLLGKGANANAADKDGRTPLHDATQTGSERIIRWLLNKGANANAADKDRRTPLHDAAKAGSEDVIQLLLDKGANANATDKDGRTPLHNATKAGSEDIRPLLDMSANVKLADIDPARDAEDKPVEGSDLVELRQRAKATDSFETHSVGELNRGDYDFPYWRARVTSDLRETIRDNLEYCEVSGSGPLWTCTPSKDTPVEQIPLTIGGHPVVIPVEYHYSASAFTMPPPDPHPHSIDPSIEIDEDTINEIFEIFEGVLGFYLLINGMLQLIVPDNFDFQYALSHRPSEFGGTKISYIRQAMTPTAERREHGSSSASVKQPLSILLSETRQGNDMSQPASSTQSTIQIHTTSSSGTSPTRRPGSGGTPRDLMIGSVVQARVEGANKKEKFQGKIGLMTEANDRYYLVISSHILTQALVAAKSDRFPGKDWVNSVSVIAGNEGQEVRRPFYYEFAKNSY